MGSQFFVVLFRLYFHPISFENRAGNGYEGFVLLLPGLEQKSSLRSTFLHTAVAAATGCIWTWENGDCPVTGDGRWAPRRLLSCYCLKTAPVRLFNWSRMRWTVLSTALSFNVLLASWKIKPMA